MLEQKKKKKKKMLEQGVQRLLQYLRADMVPMEEGIPQCMSSQEVTINYQNGDMSNQLTDGGRGGGEY